MKTAFVIGAIVLGGSAIGLAVERTGYSPIGEPEVSVGLNEVPFYPCPGDDVVGFFHGGDRVLVTGRSSDGVWLEARAPFDVTTRVWLEADFATPDSDLGHLPVTECEEFAIVTLPASTTTSTNAATATTSASATTATTSASATTATTSSPTTTATTLPADQEGPNVGFFNSFPGDIWEDGVGCEAQQHEAVVSAVVADPSGISSVQLSVSVGGSQGVAFMTEGPPAVYSVTVGPFENTTLSGSDAPIELELTAFDAFSNSTNLFSATLLELHDCAIG